MSAAGSRVAAVEQAIADTRAVERVRWHAYSTEGGESVRDAWLRSLMRLEQLERTLDEAGRLDFDDAGPAERERIEREEAEHDDAPR